MRGVVLLVAIGVSACSSKTIDLDYASYPKIPMSLPVKTLRLVVMNPLSKKKAIWGNYGGPGNRGGAPVDAQDALYRLHDISYLEVMKYNEIIDADRNLVEGLDRLDESKMNAHGKLFRERAIKYFSSPISRVLGKPWDLLFDTRKVPIIRDIGRGID